MRLLPYVDDLVILSPLSPIEALARLRDATGPRKLLRLGRSPHAFEGEVNGSEVRIQRIIGYRNSFLPRVRGRIEPHAGGSRLAGTMSMHPLVTVFMTLWLGIALVAAVLMTLLLFWDDSIGALALIPAGMAIFSYAVISVVFRLEAGFTHRELAETLEAVPGAN